MSKFNDITNRRFGRLVALSWERVLYANRMQVLWTCRCDCGETIRPTSSSLKRGAVKSCGCLNVEETVARSRTHGMRHSPIYNVWTGMRARCGNPNDISYPNYGGRGIAVCERWQSFENFFADMGERPSAAHQIDRIDNDGNYEPGNCRWSDRVEQGTNRRNNVLLTHNGRTQTVAQWSRDLHISQIVLRRRISLGWPVDRVLTEPVRTAPGSGRRE